MPFSLIPTQTAEAESGEKLSRRMILKAALATSAGVLAGSGTGLISVASVAGAADVQSGVKDQPWVAFISDTHIAADSTSINRSQNMTKNLAEVVRQVLAEPTRPSAALIDGDLALGTGQRGDYQQLLKLLEPMQAAGVPVHLALGNHDDRGNFREVLGDSAMLRSGKVAAVESHHTLDVTIAGTRFIVLDSLQRPNYTPGAIGAAQKSWLTEALKRHEDTPTLIFVHHNPALIPTAGLTDTAALYEVIVPAQQVKAVVFGHTHVWNPWGQHEGVKLLNIPAVGYPHDKVQPIGWTKFVPLQGGALIELASLDANHAAHGQRVLYNWR